MYPDVSFWHRARRSVICFASQSPPQLPSNLAEQFNRKHFYEDFKTKNFAIALISLFCCFTLFGISLLSFLVCVLFLKNFLQIHKLSENCWSQERRQWTQCDWLDSNDSSSLLDYNSDNLWADLLCSDYSWPLKGERKGLNTVSKGQIKGYKTCP